MNSEQRKAYYTLHFCVLIWGFTAILGNLISLTEGPLVFYRMGITSVSILFIPEMWKNIKNISKKEFLKTAGIGILVACHWVTFYGSIKYSNVSVAVSCIATVSFFTSFIEPLVMRTRIKQYEVILGVAVVPAIYLIFYFTGRFYIGIILGLTSSLFASLFSVLNKKMVAKHNPVSLTFIELGTGFIFMICIMPLYIRLFPSTTLIPTQNDVVYLLILSIICTTIPFTLSMKCLRYLSAFTSNLTINLEPVYGIILAAILFHEYNQLNTGFYIGAFIIISIVFINPVVQKYFSAKSL